MKNIIPKNTRYVPLTQQKWCCVPTCVQMVMLRHNIPLQPVELIGYEMGLTVPEDGLKYFWNAHTGPRSPAGYGTTANKPKNSPNAVFKRLKIPLKMTWALINKFPTYEDFLKKLKTFTNTNDWLVCFDWGKLHDIDTHNGHVCVLEHVDTKQETLRIVDPDYFSVKWQTYPIKKLYESMVFHGKSNSGGIWELEKI